MAPSGLRVVVFPETGGRWTARGLDHDIAAQGRTVDAAVDTLLRIASAHIAFDRRHNREPLSAFGRAPRAYWSAFARGNRLPPVGHLESPGHDVLPEVIAAVVPHHPCMRELLPITWTA